MPIKNGKTITCNTCEEQFYKSKSRIHNQNYCSTICRKKRVVLERTRKKSSLSHIGKPSPLKGRKTGVIPKFAFKKGHKTWNKGISWSNPKRMSGQMTICKECEKDFYQPNCYVGERFFCNRRCYSSWLSKNILDESHQFFGKTHSEQSKKLMKISRSKIIPQFTSSLPERKLQSILSVNGIKYEKQKLIFEKGFYHRVDFFIEPNIIIEVDGCYWHGCTNQECRTGKNNTKKGLTLKQKERVERDNKIKTIVENQGFKFLRFWEHEINNKLNTILSKMKEEILT